MADWPEGFGALKKKVTVYLTVAQWQFLQLTGLKAGLKPGTVATELLAAKIAEEQAAALEGMRDEG